MRQLLLCLCIGYTTFAHTQNIYDITAFGAVNSTAVISTAAIQQAINKCAAAGGGTVTVPPGNYTTGTITLASNINLHLNAGAILHASANLEDYTVLPGVTNDNYKEGVKGLINCTNATNVSITGEGEINLHGETFIDRTKPPVFDTPVDSLQQSQGVVVMKERPNQLIFFSNCSNISVRDVKIINSPCMILVMSNCDVVNIQGVYIDNNNLKIPNSDGIHLSGCKNVTLTNCRIFTDDDCIAVTSLVHYDDYSQNILIANSVLESSSAGVRLGYLRSRVTNVILKGLIINNSNRGIIISAGKGGYVKNVNVESCIIDAHIKVGRWWGNGEAIAMFRDDKVNAQGLFITTDTTNKYLDNISFSNIQATSENGIHIIAAPNNIRNIFFNNCSLTLVDSHNRPVAGSFYDIQPAGYRPRKPGTLAAIYADGVTNLYLNGVTVNNGLLKQHGLNITTQLNHCIVKRNDITFTGN
ncbi:MAG TPA: glycosyl hydrolase family 28 protein [Chitinophagaceae bacterium]|nr:glycosyl hydrolase family 28 protein [Chitinophagaceae bacterium]